MILVINEHAFREYYKPRKDFHLGVKTNTHGESKILPNRISIHTESPSTDPQALYERIFFCENVKFVCWIDTQHPIDNY